jgi:drug/metabolite transporter (DMT)-like permease
MLIIATSIWGSAFIGGKFATQDFAPISVAFFRFFGASIILLPLLFIKKQWPKEIKLKDWILFFLLGLTGIFLYNIAFFMATKYTTIIKSSLFIGSNPIIIAILSGLFLRETITKKHIIGLISAILGALYIIINGDFAGFYSLGFQRIDWILLLAVLCWASYSVLGKVSMMKYTPLQSTTFGCVIGTLLLFPFAVFSTSITEIQNASLSTWLWLIEMAVLVTVVSFLMWNNGIKHVGASKAALFINFMPLSAVLMAAIFLNETVSVHHIIGAIFIFTGVYVGTMKKRNKRNFANNKKVVS